MQRWGRFFTGKVLERGLSTETIGEWSAAFEAVLALIQVLSDGLYDWLHVQGMMACC